MSITRRFLDLARSNLNALLDRAGPSELGRYSDDELAQELEQRRDRQRRQSDARAARETAERAARERTRSTASPPHGNGAKANGGNPKLASLYAQLETPAGSDLETVKRNFRRLMRLHHPDLHGESPAAQKAATERTMRLTAAYDELERLLAPIAAR